MAQTLNRCYLCCYICYFCCYTIFSSNMFYQPAPTHSQTAICYTEQSLLRPDKCPQALSLPYLYYRSSQSYPSLLYYPPSPSHLGPQLSLGKYDFSPQHAELHISFRPPYAGDYCRSPPRASLLSSPPFPLPLPPSLPPLYPTSTEPIAP